MGQAVLGYLQNHEERYHARYPVVATSYDQSWLPVRYCVPSWDDNRFTEDNVTTET